MLLGRIDAGKKEVEAAVKLDPGNVKARLILGELHLKNNDPVAAEKEAVEVLRRNPANFQAAVLYGDAFLLRKEWKKAEQVYTMLIRQMPKSPIGYFKMGLSSKMQNKPLCSCGLREGRQGKRGSRGLPGEGAEKPAVMGDGGTVPSCLGEARGGRERIPQGGRTRPGIPAVVV
jgi:tetratricopeptide (TPR) repeat protein